MRDSASSVVVPKNNLDTIVGCTDIRNPFLPFFRGDAKLVKRAFEAQV